LYISRLVIVIISLMKNTQQFKLLIYMYFLKLITS